MSPTLFDFIVLKYVLKTAHNSHISKIEYNMAEQCEGTERNWRRQCRFYAGSIGLNELLKILIEDEYMERFMQDPAMKVSIFL